MNRMVEYSHRFFTPVFEEGERVNVGNVDVKSLDSQLLDYIYGVDPVSGLPVGDLSVYLGTETNPDIKRYIEMNLLSPVENGKGVSFSTEELNKIKGSITDDDIARFSRNHNETKEEYADRLRSFFEKEKYERAEKRRKDEYQKLVSRISNGE